jgi:hypothetical protein
MEHHESECIVKARLFASPFEWQWEEYDSRKRDIFLESETREEYHARLRKLIDELGI